MKNKLTYATICLLAIWSLAGCNATPISSFGEAANGRSPSPATAPSTDPKTKTGGLLDAVVGAEEKTQPPTVSLEGEFDPAKALRAVYGTYNTEQKRAQWKPTKEELNRFSFYNNIQTLYSRAYFTKAFEQNGVDRYFVITRTAPSKSDCEDCVPVLGGAVFTRNGEEWELDAQSKMITRTGSHGELSNGRVVKLGPEKYGVMFHWKATSEGVTEEGDLLIAETKNGLKEVFSMVTGGDNKKHCQDIGAYADESPCWAYRSKLDFVPNANSSFYDLRVASEGTKQVEENNVIPVRETKRFVFSETGYRPTR